MRDPSDPHPADQEPEPARPDPAHPAPDDPDADAARRRWIAEQLARAPQPTTMTISIIVAILTDRPDDDQEDNTAIPPAA